MCYNRPRPVPCALLTERPSSPAAAGQKRLSQLSQPLPPRPPLGLSSAAAHPGPFRPTAAGQPPGLAARWGAAVPTDPAEERPASLITPGFPFLSPLRRQGQPPAVRNWTCPPLLPVTAARGTPGNVVPLSARAAPPPGDGTSNPVVPRAVPSARCVPGPVVKLRHPAPARAAQGTACPSVPRVPAGDGPR